MGQAWLERAVTTFDAVQVTPCNYRYP